jgi:hypothetical protein
LSGDNGATSGDSAAILGVQTEAVLAVPPLEVEE